MKNLVPKKFLSIPILYRASLFLILHSSFFIFNPARAQWWDTYSEKTGLVLSLHQSDSTFELYSPLQTSDPIPISKWSLRNDTLRLECASIGFKATLTHSCSSPSSFANSPSKLEGVPDTKQSCSSPKLGEGNPSETRMEECVWTGTWRQGLLKETVTFHPVDTLFQLRRPQTPQPPYRFNEETVAVDYVDSHGNTVHLEGTLTYPKQSNSSPQLGEGDRRSTAVEECVKYPTLLLVSGSGQQNRDEEIFQHKPFLVLADYLATRGIAVLRYDDRGVGASYCSSPSSPSNSPSKLEGVAEGQGRVSTASRGVCINSADTYLFSEDAEALFNVLKNNPHVDPNRLGIGGHSEGGAIAPMVAARNKDVKFVLMLAGQGCTGLEVLVQQNEALFRTRGVSDSLCALRAACMHELFAASVETQRAASHTYAASHLSVKDYQNIILRHTEGLSKEQIDSIDLKKGSVYALKQQLDTRWMQTFLTLDPADFLPKVKCPVLALNGSNDLQVLPHPNLDRIRQLCPQADCRELPGLNHLFQHCTTGLPSEYMMTEETFAPEAMKAIADWILALP